MIGHLTTDDELLIDGEHVGPKLPRTMAMAGRTVYIAGGRMREIALKYLTPADSVAGPTPGSVAAITVNADSPALRWHIRGGDAWGLDHNPERAKKELAELMDGCDSLGIPFKGTASGSAWAYAKTLGVTPKMKRESESPPLAAESFYSGPMMVCVGSAKDCVEWDRNQAYLNAMNGDIPIPGSARFVGRDWKERKSAIVQARVTIPEMHIGPLPIRLRGITCWPVGRVTGAWHASLLLNAMENHGVKVEKIIAVTHYTAVPWLRPFVDAVARIESKPLRKRLYTRYWGRWGSPGWYNGTPDGGKLLKAIQFNDTCDLMGALPGEPDYPTALGAVEQWTEPARPLTYRPEIAGAITCAASLPVINFAIAAKAHACHVDAVWCQHEHNPGDGWTAKNRGDARFYAIGTYRHGDKVAAQGFPIRERCDAEVWASEMDSYGTMKGRTWKRQEGPAGHPNAISRAIRAQMWE